MKKISETVGGLKSYAFKHKIISILVIAATASGIYNAVLTLQSGNQTTTYTLSTVSPGTIISTVTGSGQISANEQVAVVSQASGALTSLPVTDGEEVTAGQLLATVDATDAARSLQSAKIALAKLEEAPATTTLTSTQNSIVTSYEDSFNDVVSTFVNLPTIVSGIDNLLNTQSEYLSDTNTEYLNDTARSLRDTALQSDSVADNDYQSSINLYKTVTRQSASSTIEALVESTYTTVKAISQAIKDERTAVDFIQSQTAQQYQSQADSTQNNLTTWSSEVDNYIATLLADENSIVQSSESLTTLVNGPDALDIQSQELSIQAAQETYNNYFIYTPISGILSLAAKPTDTVSNGTTIGTIISQQKIATISLNEIDAAKVQIGDKATLTFDAVNNLSIAGHVSDVSVIGTVSSGVVTYTITIALDTNDSRIKPGMSVNAAIVTDVEENVLTVPNAAIKTQGSISYVQELPQKVSAAQVAAGVTSATPPKNIPVTVGVSNSTVTEILSGLSSGDQVIIKTTTSGSSATTGTATSAAAPSLFGTAGGRGGGFGGGAGGAVRVP